MRSRILFALPLLVLLGGCKAVPDPIAGNGADGTINADDGKHTISAVGKWKYGTKVAPADGFISTCRWEVWGLQKDDWQLLDWGKGRGTVTLPPDGVYSSAYLKSRSCGKWHKA